MDTVENARTSKLKALTNNGFLGFVVGMAVGLVVDNLFIGIGLAVALGVAWYAGKRKGTGSEAKS